MILIMDGRTAPRRYRREHVHGAVVYKPTFYGSTRPRNLSLYLFLTRMKMPVSKYCSYMIALDVFQRE